MRCSSCETLLDRYVEATLPARDMRAISLHLKGCSQCSELLTELRVVDALLATTQAVDLAPNFTFAIMAEVSAMPVPRQRRAPIWAMLTLYLVAAWGAITLIALALGTRLPALANVYRPAIENVGAVGHAFAGTAVALGPLAPIMVIASVALVIVDVALLFAVVFFYRKIRPHLVAAFATSEAP